MPVERLASRWYAIRTQPRFEKIVRDYLTKLIEAALFARYCFACFPSTQRPLVLQAPGVLEILCNRDEVEFIVSEEMAEMQQLVQSSLHYEATFAAEEGETVEIVRGPLLGIRGKCLKRGDHNWVVVPMSLIGKAGRLELS